MNPVVWSLFMLLLLALSALTGHRLGGMLADRRHKIARRDHESERLPREKAQDRPSGLVMRFVDGSPQIESSSANLPDEDVVEKMLEDAQAYVNSVHREPGQNNKSDLTGQGVAIEEDRETTRERDEKPIRNWNLGLDRIPVMGSVAAGAPILAEEDFEAQPVAEELFGDAESFLLRIEGDSMVNVGILDGDFVVVHPQEPARDGDIVLALINGEDEATLRQLKWLEDKYLLFSENPAYSPIDAAHATILGRVVGVIRHIRKPQ